MESLQDFILSSGAPQELVDQFTKNLIHKHVKKGMTLQVSGEKRIT